MSAKAHLESPEVKEHNGTAHPFGGSNSTQMERRKNEHIDICLNEDVDGLSTGAGFDRYRFRHNALPELALDQIDMTTSFLGRAMKAPFLISSMTGGTEEAGLINRRLAEAAQRQGWAMGLGSGRVALESERAAATFLVRDIAPEIPLLANLGAVQLGLGFGVEECKRLLEETDADGLVLHLNALQEAFQSGGDTDFRGLLNRIESLCRELGKPVGVKEVGWGIDGETAKRLFEAGAAFIDVAGAGGTSWSEVEKRRSHNALHRSAADAFKEWGTPTAACIREARAASPLGSIIGSGGITSGVDAAKALALGADLAGFGRSLLRGAADSVEQLDAIMIRIAYELRVAMFGIGAPDLAALRSTNRLTMV